MRLLCRSLFSSRVAVLSILVILLLGLAACVFRSIIFLRCSRHGRRRLNWRPVGLRLLLGALRVRPGFLLLRQDGCVRCGLGLRLLDGSGLCLRFARRFGLSQLLDAGRIR